MFLTFFVWTFSLKLSKVTTGHIYYIVLVTDIKISNKNNCHERSIITFFLVSYNHRDSKLPHGSYFKVQRAYFYLFVGEGEGERMFLSIFTDLNITYMTLEVEIHIANKWWAEIMCIMNEITFSCQIHCFLCRPVFPRVYVTAAPYRKCGVLWVIPTTKIFPYGCFTIIVFWYFP